MGTWHLPSASNVIIICGVFVIYLLSYDAAIQFVHPYCRPTVYEIVFKQMSASVGQCELNNINWSRDI